MAKLDPEGNELKDNSPCAGVRADLKICLLESDCVRKVKLYYNTNFYCLKTY